MSPIMTRADSMAYIINAIDTCGFAMDPTPVIVRGVATKKNKKPKWRCGYCLVLNKNKRGSCKACGAPRIDEKHKPWTEEVWSWKP